MQFEDDVTYPDITLSELHTEEGATATEGEEDAAAPVAATSAATSLSEMEAAALVAAPSAASSLSEEDAAAPVAGPSAATSLSEEMEETRGELAAATRALEEAQRCVDKKQTDLDEALEELGRRKAALQGEEARLARMQMKVAACRKAQVAAAALAREVARVAAAAKAAAEAAAAAEAPAAVEVQPPPAAPFAAAPAPAAATAAASGVVQAADEVVINPEPIDEEIDEEQAGAGGRRSADSASEGPLLQVRHFARRSGDALCRGRRPLPSVCEKEAQGRLGRFSRGRGARQRRCR